MPIDPYSPCPGGTGKKLKFCCSDLQTELDKAYRMLEGDQTVACLEYIKRLEGTHPRRACLLSMRTELQFALQQNADAESTIADFRREHPANPVALGYDAMLKAARGEVAVAVDLMQSALEAGGKQIMPAVYEALGVVGQALLAERHLPAGRAHLLLQAGLAGEQDPRAMRVLMQLNTSNALPVLLKEVQKLSSCPEGVLWKKAFGTAQEAGQQAHWRSAEQQFTALVPNASSSPAIWRNLGLLRSWLGDDAGSATAWRKYAGLEVPLDDAVEAEATAQLLEDDPIGPPVDQLAVDYPITDFDELERRLSADRRVSRMQVDLSTLADEGTPPPRGAFWLLDREEPRLGAALRREEIPNALGQFLLYGRETDREARLELTVHRDETLEPAKQMLVTVAGGSIGPSVNEEVAAQTPALQRALSWNWKLPADTPVELQRALVDEQRRAIVLERWPNTPMRILDGQSPLAAAKNPAYKIRLLAAILNLELTATEPDSDALYNQLRLKLGLPAGEPIAPSGQDLLQARLCRLHRFETVSMSAEQLMTAFSVAASNGVEFAGQRFAEAMVARKGEFRGDVLMSAYRFLLSTTSEPTKALTYLQAGRAAAQAAGLPIGPWDLDELRLRIAQGDAKEMSRLIATIARDHRGDQQTMQELYGLLSQLGLVGPDGTMRVPIAPPTEGTAEPTAAALWTPESAQPSGEKSKLWLPGME